MTCHQNLIETLDFHSHCQAGRHDNLRLISREDTVDGYMTPQFFPAVTNDFLFLYPGVDM